MSRAPTLCERVRDVSLALASLVVVPVACAAVGAACGAVVAGYLSWLVIDQGDVTDDEE